MTNQSTPIINHFVAVIKSEQFNNSIEKIEEVAQSIVADMELNVVKKLNHMFFPQGITLVYILSESHLVIHTWPESGLIHIDLVTCVSRTKKEFKDSLKHTINNFNPTSVEIKSVNFSNNKTYSLFTQTSKSQASKEG